MFYLRTQKFNKHNGQWVELLDHISPVDVETTGYEPSSGDIAYLPLNIRLTPKDISDNIYSFKNTIVDITLLRLPSNLVFAIKKVCFFVDDS